MMNEFKKRKGWNSTSNLCPGASKPTTRFSVEPSLKNYVKIHNSFRRGFNSTASCCVEMLASDAKAH